jgi:hypothetical protein
MTPNQSPSSTTNPPESNEVRRYLEKILASKVFANAPRAQQFLRFVIEEALAGRAGEIKEPVVAARVFNLGGDFDRRRNSIVRAEATHLRRRLRDYYMSAGSSDSVIIDLPPRGYMPFIRTSATGGGKPQDAGRRRFEGLVSLFRRGKSTPRE